MINKLLDLHIFSKETIHVHIFIDNISVFIKKILAFKLVLLQIINSLYYDTTTTTITTISLLYLGDGWAATTIPSDWYESSTAYWYDTPDAIPSEDEEKCCERANGLCEWLEPPCPYLAEEDRKIYAWDNKTCFEIHPDDMAEIRERFDWYNLAKKNVLYANVS